MRAVNAIMREGIVLPRIALASAAGLAVLSLTAAAAAQNLAADPLYGTVTLTTGFVPDPVTVEVQAGGPDSASNLGPGCTGYIMNAQPDVRLNYTAGPQYPLNLYVISQADTTLAVNLPNGQWVCNDDANQFNPLVSLQQPESGQYDIWIGTFQPGATPPATLYISELSPQWQAAAGPAVQPDVMADPLYGTMNLTAGFTPDPQQMEVLAGGPNSADPLGPACRGYINAMQPDARLNFEAGRLPLYIYVRSQADTTLAVNLPNGQWVCNDDSQGLNPAVPVQPAMSGQYDIWVGTYSPGPTPPATLYVSELSAGTAPQPIAPAPETPTGEPPAAIQPEPAPEPAEPAPRPEMTQPPRTAPEDGADAATPDEGETDAATPDEGETDAATPDEGETDAATPDEGETDAATPDEGGTGETPAQDGGSKQ